MAYVGGSLMPNTGESLNVVVESTLLDILETGDLPHKYFLSPLACRGIIRRAKNRDKELPPTLQHALEAAAGVEYHQAGGSTSSQQSPAVSKKETPKEPTPTQSQDTLFPL
jgi:hypothetical protein